MAGNTLALATILSLQLTSQNVQGTVNSNNSEFYKFTLASQSAVTFTLVGLSSDADLQILNSAGNVVSVNGTVQESIGTGNLAESLNPTLPAGTYYLRVFEKPLQPDTSYTLNFAGTALDLAGNTTAAALNIANGISGGTAFGGYFDTIGGSSDLDDYYKFTVDFPSTIPIGINNYSANETMNYAVLDSSSQVVASTSVNPGSFVGGPVSLQPGTYYFRVYQTSSQDTNNGPDRYAVKISAARPGASPFISPFATLIPGDKGSDLINTVKIGSTIYFLSNGNDGPAGLWQTDGTALGTVLIKQFTPGSSELVAAGSTLYFVVNDPNTGIELWKSNGTEAGTSLVKDINPNSESSSPLWLTVNGNILYFQANDGVNGTELWKSDGTSAGTVIVKNINTDTSQGSQPSYLTVFNGQLYFSAFSPSSGYELWKSDGTSAGTVLVKEINSDNCSSNPRSLTVVGSTLFFSALKYDCFLNPTINGVELWKSDGTSAGTVIVKDINPGQNDSNPNWLTAIGSNLYFTATDGTNGIELWKSDGTSAGTVQVKNINTSGDSKPQWLTAIGSNLYFQANDGVNGVELWKSDGTGAGTTLVKDINTSGDSNPLGYTQLGANVYFTASSSTSGAELWKTDGTTANTLLVKDLNSGSDSSNPLLLNVLGTNVVFSAYTNQDGGELWKSDGSSGGTTQIKDVNPVPKDAPREFLTIGSTTYFVATTPNEGTELWKTNGTSGGTALLKDIVLGSGSSSPYGLTSMGGNLYFGACDTTNKCELWKSDGTSAGTTLLSNIDTVSGQGSEPTSFVVIGSNPG